MFYPVQYYVRNYTTANKRREKQILSLWFTFTLMIFLSHIFACYLILVGYSVDNLGFTITEENEKLWIANNLGLWSEETTIFLEAPKEELGNIEHQKD